MLKIQKKPAIFGVIDMFIDGRLRYISNGEDLPDLMRWATSVTVVRCKECEFFIPDVECKFFNNAFVDENGGCTYGKLKGLKEDANGKQK